MWLQPSGLYIIDRHMGHFATLELALCSKKPASPDTLQLLAS